MAQGANPREGIHTGYVGRRLHFDLWNRLAADVPVKFKTLIRNMATGSTAIPMDRERVSSVPGMQPGNRIVPCHEVRVDTESERL